QYVPHAFDRRGITFAINLLPVLTRALGRIRIVSNFHELFIPFDGSLKRSLGALWQRLMAALLAFGSDTITVTTREWRRRLTRLGIRKQVQVIPVGSNVPVAGFEGEGRDNYRKELLHGADGLLVAGFGSLRDRDFGAVLYGLQKLQCFGRVKL